METLIVQSKNKATTSLVKKLLQELKGIENVSQLSASGKEDIALIKAINKGRTGKYIDTDAFLKKL
jgi:hypothetical protein